MTDDELIKLVHAARDGAHNAWKNTDGTRPTDWSGSARRFIDLVEQAEAQGISRHVLFDNTGESISE